MIELLQFILIGYCFVKISRHIEEMQTRINVVENTLYEKDSWEDC